MVPPATFEELADLNLPEHELRARVEGLIGSSGDVLGLTPDDVEVVQGDTQAVPFGTGTFNSRTMAIG